MWNLELFRALLLHLHRCGLFETAEFFKPNVKAQLMPNLLAAFQ